VSEYSNDGIVMPCSLVDIYQQFGGTCCLRLQVTYIGRHLANYMLLHPGRHR